MNNFIKIAFIILFILSTVITIAIRPPLHDPVVVVDSDFKITNITDDIVPQSVPTLSIEEPQNIEVPSAQETVVNINISEPYVDKTQTIVDLFPEQNSKTVVNVVPQQKNNTETKVVKIQETPSKNVLQQTNSNKSQIELLERVMKNAEKEVVVSELPVQKPVEKVSNQTNQQVTLPKTQPVQQTQPVKVVNVQPTTQTNKNPYMTEQEEIIAWNIWRSNIQNQIMKDSNIGFAPYGTAFTFSFVVDKFGNISNIKVESSHPYFMDAAREGVKPAISGLQGKPILNFPKGTQRTVTTVNGNFVISNKNTFSTPSDFNDYERVKR